MPAPPAGPMPLRAARAGPLLFLLCLFPPPASAESAPGPVHVVRRDPGGPVEPRLAEIAALRRAGARVEIRGGCWSACTLYLGLPGTCVSRAARLGFHGPASQRRGIGLTPAAFEHWSRVMAAHYPEPLRGWYLREGRRLTLGFREISGAELIRLGIAECPPG